MIKKDNKNLTSNCFQTYELLLRENYGGQRESKCVNYHELMEKLDVFTEERKENRVA